MTTANSLPMHNTNDYIRRGDAIDAVHERILQIGYENDSLVLSIRQAVRDVPAADVVKVVRCNDCIYWNPPHVIERDGTERPYRDGEIDPVFHIPMVSVEVGINVGGQCTYDANRGYEEDKTVFRTADDFCSKGLQKEDI